jgi:tetratricopeptide (TPR) repeat protein/serine/threonine protein kinase
MSDATSDPDPLLPLAEEFAERYRRGERPTLTEYADRHPELAERIRRLFPTLAVMEEFGSVGGEPTGPYEAVAAAAPARLGEYRILREVGRGGMGVVYEAVQESLGRHVALKVLPGHRLLSPLLLSRFEREAKAAARLHHTNIVPVYGVGEAGGVHFYAMQFIQGQSVEGVLRELRCRRGGSGGSANEPTRKAAGAAPDPGSAGFSADPASGAGGAGAAPPAANTSELSGRSDAEYFRSVARIGVQAAEALDHAHAQGVLHRDIKPANLLIDGQGAVWVTDFGLAKLEGSDDLTGEGEVPGTLRYTAPERFSGPADARSDLYSLGLTLYELLTLRPAFDAGTRAELIARILHAEPPRPRALDPHLPRDLEAVILKALAREPAERYQTAGELADDLRRFLEDLPVHARRPTAVQRLRKWMWRRRAVVTTAAAGLLAALLVLAGSVGWSLQGRIAREQQVTGQVEAANDDVAAALRAGNWADARASLQKARALWDRGATDAQRQETDALDNDLAMAEMVEAVRLNHAALKYDPFGNVKTDESYVRAFREYGIDVDALPPAEAGERIRARPIAPALAAALDDWAATRWGLAELAGPRAQKMDWRHLLAVAKAADPDAARGRIRDALAPGHKDTTALKALAASIGTDAAAQGALPPQTMIFFAEALGEAREYEAELAVLRLAQTLYPGDFWVNYNLATVLHGSGELDDAIRYYTAAASLRPDTSVVYTSLGPALAAKGKYREGIALLRRALAKEPNLVAAHNNLANVLAEMGDLPGALFHLRRAIELNPENPTLYLNLGATLSDQAGLDEAVAALSPPAGGWAGVSFHLAHLDAALAAQTKAVKLLPGNTAAHYNRGLLLADLGKYAEAAADLRKAAEGDPAFARVHFHLGLALEKQNKLDEAEAAFVRAVAARARPGASNLFRQAGHQMLARARPLKPAVAYLALARVRCKLGRLPGAEDACAKSVAAAREEAAARYDIHAQHDLALAQELLGRILAEKRNYAGAEAALREALVAWAQAGRMKPNDDQALTIRHNLAQTHHYLGRALAGQEKYAEAEAAYREALPGLPAGETANTRLLLGLALEQQGRLSEAEASFGHAIDACQRPAEGSDADSRYDLGRAYYALGKVLAKQGKNDKAEEAVNEAIAVLTPLAEGRPETPDSGCELARAYCILAEARKAFGRVPQAQEANRAAVAVAEKLFKDFPGDKSQEALAGALTDLTVSSAEKDRDALECSLRRARDLWRGLAEKHAEDSLYGEGLAMATSRLGGMLLQKNEYAEAEQVLGDAVRLRRDFLSKERRAPGMRFWLASDLSQQSRLFAQRGQTDRAEKGLDEAEELLRPLAEQFSAFPHYKQALAENHFNRGRLREDAGSDRAERDFRQARDLFEELAEKHPDEPAYRRSLASCLNSLGRVRIAADPADAERSLCRALKLWDALVAKYPEDSDYRKHQGVCCSTLGQFLQNDPARVAEAYGFTMRAFAIYEKLAEENEGVPQYQSALAGELHNVAFVFRDQGKLTEARAHMERAVKVQQAALNAVGGRNARYRRLLWTHYWGLAEILLALEDHAAAARAVENMPRIDADGWEPCFRAVPLLATCALLADKDDSLPTAERKRLYDSHVARAKELLAEAQKRIDAAKPQTVGQKRQLADGAVLVGNLYFDMRDAGRARQSYEKAVALCPDLAVAQYKLGGILYHHREFRGAADAFRLAIKHRPDYAEAHEGLAMALGAQGKDFIEDAVAAYRKAGELYKDKKEAARMYGNFGAFLGKNQRLPEAEDAFRKAVELQPKSEEAHANLGLALGQQGKTKEAIASFREAIDIKPDYAPAWCNLGFALYRDKQPAEALKALKEALRLLPADDPVRPRIEALMRECERLIEAEKK